VNIVMNLPKSGVGKILRRELRDQAKEQIEEAARSTAP